MIYCIYIIINILFICIFDGAEVSNNKRFSYCFLVAFLVLLTGLSRDMGADSWTFRADFEFMPESIDRYSDISYYVGFFMLKGYMPFWTLLNMFLKSVFGDFVAVHFVLSLFLNISVGYLFYKHCSKPFTCLLFYFLLCYLYFNLEVMRESFAVLIGFFAVESYLAKKTKTFLLFCFLAFMFHASAVILLLLPVLHFKVTPLTLVITGFISLILFLISNFLVASLPGYFDSFSLGHKLVSATSRTASVFGFISVYIKFLFIPIISYLLLPKKRIAGSILSKIMPFAVGIGVISCSIVGLSRWNDYWSIYSCLLLAELFWSVLLVKRTLIIKATAVLVFLFTFNEEFSRYLHAFSNGYYKYDLYLPYSNVFDQEKDYSYRDAIHEAALLDAEDAALERK